MGKVIVIKKEDLGVIYLIPSADKYGEGLKPYSECKGLQEHIDKGRDWFVCENDDLPKKSEIESRKQLYHDGYAVKIDTDWSRRLMPAHCVRKRHLAIFDKEIDAELNGQDVDIKKISNVQRQREMVQIKRCTCPLVARDTCACTCGYELFWAETALQNLDKRVAKGESDKPVIREKLQQILQKLKKEEK